MLKPHWVEVVVRGLEESVSSAFTVDGRGLGYIVRVATAAVLVVGKVYVRVLHLALALHPVILALDVRVTVSTVTKRIAKTIA